MSHLRLAVPAFVNLRRSAENGLAAAYLRELRRDGKFVALPPPTNYLRFVPFVLESLRALDAHADPFLGIISKRAIEACSASCASVCETLHSATRRTKGVDRISGDEILIYLSSTQRSHRLNTVDSVVYRLNIVVYPSNLTLNGCSVHASMHRSRMHGVD